MQRHVQYREPNGNGHALDALLLGPKKSVIKWTQAEQKLIAQKLADQIISKPFTRSFKKAIKIAQEELTKEGKLDADRHREIQSVNMVKPIMTVTREVLSRYREQAKQVDKAHEILKTQHQKNLTREQVLDSLTDEEIEVFFRDKVMALTSPQELLKYFSPQDLLANLSTAAILSTATYRMTEQMEQQITAMTHMASVVSKLVPASERPTLTIKPLVQIAGINLKRIDEIRPQLADHCDVQRIDLIHLSSSSICESARYIILWSNQVKNFQKEAIKKFAYLKNLAPNQIIETQGSLERIVPNSTFIA